MEPPSSPAPTPPAAGESRSVAGESPPAARSCGRGARLSALSATEPGAAPTTLILPAGARARVAAWTRAEYPEEACGLLVGRVEGERVVVVRAERARNLVRERRRDRFDLDPVAYVVADRAARAEGLEIVGIWHSHPDQLAVPSEADRRAAWANTSYLIASVDDHDVRELTSWRLAGERFAREQVTAE